MKKKLIVVLSVVALLIIIGGGVYWMRSDDLPITEGTSAQETTEETSVQQTTKRKTDDELLEINDSGFARYDLREFIILLQEMDIAITDIKGASKAFWGDGGNVRFESTNWNYAFGSEIDSPYDVNSLDNLIQRQEIEAVYVKTQFEIFTFRQSMGHPGRIYPIDGYFSNVITTTNPRFATEKGIKIGDSFEAAANAYGFSDEAILKTSDSDWMVWAYPNPDYVIRLVGSKEGISSIELGHHSFEM